MISQIHDNIFTEVALVFALRAVQIMLGPVTTYFLAHSLSKESFGEYHFVLKWPRLAVWFLSEK